MCRPDDSPPYDRDELDGDPVTIFSPVLPGLVGHECCAEHPTAAGAYCIRVGGHADRHVYARWTAAAELAAGWDPADPYRDRP